MPRLKQGPDTMGPSVELQERICAEVAKGYSLKAACGRLEIPDSTPRSWLKRGRDAQHQADEGEDLTPYQTVCAGFLQRYEVASAKGCLALEDESTRRARNDSGTWQEAFRKLERLHSEEWADKSRQQGEQGGIQIVIAGALEARPQVMVRGLPGADDDDHEGLPAAPSARELSP